MIEVIDRKPLGNKKNNILALTIPPEVTTVQQLIALLSGGCYGDVRANNATSGENVGVAEVGIPMNKALFDSIEEGGGGDLGGLADIAMCSDTIQITAGWTWVPFVRNFIVAPEVIAIIEDASDGLLLATRDVTTEGFYAAIVKITATTTLTFAATQAGYISSGTSWSTNSNYLQTYAKTTGNTAATTITKSTEFIAGKIKYIACCDTGVGK